MTEAAPVRPRLIGAAAIDVAVVLVFVVIGRRSHDEGGSVAGEALRVAAPFLIALALAWLAARAWNAPQAPVPTGVVVWMVTVVGGLLLRRFAFDRGIALPFIIVATLFLGAGLVGWRVIAEWRESRRAGAA